MGIKKCIGVVLCLFGLIGCDFQFKQSPVVSANPKTEINGKITLHASTTQMIYASEFCGKMGRKLSGFQEYEPINEWSIQCEE